MISQLREDALSSGLCDALQEPLVSLGHSGSMNIPVIFHILPSYTLTNDFRVLAGEVHFMISQLREDALSSGLCDALQEPLVSLGHSGSAL